MAAGGMKRDNVAKSMAAQTCLLLSIRGPRLCGVVDKGKAAPLNNDSCDLAAGLAQQHMLPLHLAWSPKQPQLGKLRAGGYCEYSSGSLKLMLPVQRR